jgi:hypothetical protein
MPAQLNLNEVPVPTLPEKYQDNSVYFNSGGGNNQANEAMKDAGPEESDDETSTQDKNSDSKNSDRPKNESRAADGQQSSSSPAGSASSLPDTNPLSDLLI